MFQSRERPLTLAVFPCCMLCGHLSIRPSNPFLVSFFASAHAEQFIPFYNLDLAST